MGSIVLPKVRTEDWGHPKDVGSVVKDPDPPDLSSASAQCNVHSVLGQHMGWEWR